jgi:predicted porin
MADRDGAWDGNLTYSALGNAAYVGSNMAGNTGDSNKINYYSPVLSGFSAGIGFTPDSGRAMNSGRQSETQDAASPTHVVEVAAKYAATVGDVDVTVSARGLSGDYGLNDTRSAATELEGARSWGAGVTVAYSGFEAAGSYTDNGDTGVTKAAKAGGSDAGGWWDVGVAYGAGPYKVSLAYMRSWAAQGAGVEDDSVGYLSLGALYAAAPGLDFYTAYQRVELDRAGTASDNTANLFMAGTQVSF